MVHLNFCERLAVIASVWLALGVAVTGIPAAMAAIQGEQADLTAEVALPPAKSLEDANTVLMTLERDGDGFEGHVRVVLSPEVRPLTPMEARIAAQEAFLETLNEPALADVVNRITIVVELIPDAGENDPNEVFFYELKDGDTWALSAAR